MPKEHVYLFKKETQEEPVVVEEQLKKALMTTFPDMRARVIRSDFFNDMVYRIPIFGGINELTIPPRKAPCEDRPDETDVYLNLHTTGLGFKGGWVNGKLRKTLDNFEFSPISGAETIREMPAAFLKTHSKHSFHLETADELIREAIEESKCSRFNAASYDGIENQHLGSYLIEKINYYARAQQIPITANYIQKFGRVEITRK